MSRMFRGKYLAALERLRNRGKLQFTGQSAGLANPGVWQDWIARLRAEPWVIYAKPPFGGPERVLKYLSRYTHRIAISNQRLTFVGEGIVRFRYRANAEGSRWKEMTLSGEEFLRRFLLHVIPAGFMRVRHYGLTANCACAEKLDRCRNLLGLPAPSAHPATGQTIDPPGDEPPHDLLARCPVCGGAFRVVSYLPPERLDTS